MSCKHCEFLSSIYKDGFRDGLEYWRFTEIFCYLHGDKDYCEYSENINIEELGDVGET